MSKTKSILRLSVLVALSLVGFIGIFCVPNDDSATWLFDLIVSKTLGAAAFYAIYRLYPRWSKIDPWLKSFEDNCDKALETKNHSQL